MSGEEGWQQVASPSEKKSRKFPVIEWGDRRLRAHPDYMPYIYKAIHQSRVPSAPSARNIDISQQPPGIKPAARGDKHSAYNCSSSFQNLAARVSVYLAEGSKKDAETVLANCISVRQYQRDSGTESEKIAYKLVEDALTLVSNFKGDVTKMWMRFYQTKTGTDGNPHKFFTLEESPAEFRAVISKPRAGTRRRKNGKKLRKTRKRT
jgi:hypothetical protein